MIADESGFNNSVVHQNYPIIRVIQGSTVNIPFCNLSSVQMFGLAIQHYLDQGVIVGPGDSSIVTFQAKDAGNFSLFSPIFTTVGAYLHGTLIVA